MALFGFGKKKESPAAPAPSQQYSIVDNVLSMRQQGYTNNQIIQELQRQKFSSSQIFDALNQADISGRSVPPGYFQGESEQAAPYPPEQSQQPIEQPYPQQESAVPNEKIEEIAESIINEKWEDLMKDIGKMIEWKNKVETRVTSMEQEMRDLKNNIENLHKAIIAKVGEYDQNILNVGTEIKAMEKVFQKVLPRMTENVNELSRITDNIKFPKSGLKAKK